MTASTDRASPLSDWSARFSAASVASGSFWIREVPFATQINLRGRGDDAEFADRVRSATECDLPAAANTWSGNPSRAAGGGSGAAGDEDCTAIWLGPDEWLLVAPDGRNEELSSALRGALDGMHHSVTDISANRTIIEIGGANARAVLAKGCPLDLHGDAFKPPQTAQTLLAKSQVILQCVDACPRFRLFVRISFARYLAEWLTDAAAELDASPALDTRRIVSRLG